MNVHPPLGINLGMMSHALLGGGSIPSWVVNPTNPPDLAVDFSNNRAWTKATKAQTTSASLLTVSRASSGTVNDSLGNWTSVGSNLPRLSDLGLLVEEARTNSIRNNSMTGAVVKADGVELLTNGTFTGTSGTGWTAGLSGGTGSVNFSVTGQATLTGDGVNAAYIEQQITGLTAGKNYVLTFGGSSATTAILIGTTQGASDLLNSSVNLSITSNPSKFAFTATQTSAWVRFTRVAASATIVSGISVQDGERVQNGGFTSNPINAAQNTVQNGWQWKTPGGTSNVAYGANSVTLTGDGTNRVDFGTAAIPTVPGFTYTVTCDVASNPLNALVTTAALTGGASLANVTLSVGTGQKFQFTATTTTSYFDVGRQSVGGATIANVSVQSAGALPTNWANSIATTNAGLVQNVVAVGTTNGVNTLDLQIVGTTTSTLTNTGWITLDGNQQIAATYGQTWNYSGFFQVISGGFTGFTSAVLNISERNSSGGALAINGSSITGAGASLARISTSATLSNASTAFVQPQLQLTVPNATAISLTFRLGWPQLENNNINSTVASAATAASGASGVNGSAVYSVGGGTGTAATLNVTWAAGVMTVNSVASAGSYTVFPPSPAALTYVSGTATGWTGATVTLTPTNNAANAFATSPIVTTSSAATRAADVVTMTSPPAFGSAMSIYTQYSLIGLITATSAQVALSLDDGTTSNRSIIAAYWQSITAGRALSASTGGAAAGGSVSLGLPVVGTTYKAASALALNDFAAVLNGGVVGTDATADIPVGINSVSFGTGSGSSFQLDGFLKSAAIWASQRVPNAQLQSMTQ